MTSFPATPPATPSPEPQRPATGRRAVRVFFLAFLVLLLAAGVFVAVQRFHSGNTLGSLQVDWRSIAWSEILLGTAAIYGSTVVRALRWALLMPPDQRPKPVSLVAPQFAGFAAVALFGRVADLTRPYLVARRTESPVATQVAVYSVERALDLAATAALFSITLLFVPRTAPHHQAFSRAGAIATAATVFLLLFAFAVRTVGVRIAHLVRTGLGGLAPGLANSAASRILELQQGFSTVRSAAQFFGAFAWSLVVWSLIALAYLLTTHCLPDTPQLMDIGVAGIMLLLATSMGASLLQLPIVGWFTQIAALAAAYHAFFGVPAGPASLCGLITFVVNTLSVIPVGLLMARWSGLSLREGRRAAPTS